MVGAWSFFCDWGRVVFLWLGPSCYSVIGARLLFCDLFGDRGQLAIQRSEPVCHPAIGDRSLFCGWSRS